MDDHAVCLKTHPFNTFLGHGCVASYVASDPEAPGIWNNLRKSRAVVFRLFQKTVFLPPNPVGFRLTCTQLWDIFFIRYHMYQFAWIKHQSVNFFQSYRGFVVLLISLFPFIIFVNMNCTFCILLVCIKLCIDHFPLHHHHLHPTYTSTMATAFHSHIHSSPDPWSSFPTVNPHSILRTPTCSRPFPHLVISFPPTGLFPSQNADSVHYVK